MIGIFATTAGKQTQLACSACSHVNCKETAVMGEPRAYIPTQASTRTETLNKAAALPESG
jgi:hypothetical protein